MLAYHGHTDGRCSLGSRRWPVSNAFSGRKPAIAFAAMLLHLVKDKLA
jgi:hypothetical protein